jgi:hypothetical protein
VDETTHVDGVMTLSDRTYKKYLRDIDDPAMQLYRRLVTESAARQGERAVAVWKCMRGAWFGSNTIMSPEAAARTLGLPVSTVTAIAKRTSAEVMPVWHASHEYKKLKASGFRSDCS